MSRLKALVAMPGALGAPHHDDEEDSGDAPEGEEDTDECRLAFDELAPFLKVPEGKADEVYEKLRGFIELVAMRADEREDEKEPASKAGKEESEY